MIKTVSCLFLFFYFILPGCHSQQKAYTVSNAHSHNDYVQKSPFYMAYQAGFGSVEADIFPVNGGMCVAHSASEIQPERTLKSLYIDPVLKELSVDTSRRLKLLIDIKEQHEICLKLLLVELAPLQRFLSTPAENKQLTILISGKRPFPSEYKNYPSYIFFDDDLKLSQTNGEWERVGQVSLPFTKYSSWKGQDEIKPADKKSLQQIIDSVHKAGKTIRFWAAPDNEASWKLQMQLGVDLIGTDKIDELAAYLRKTGN